MRRLTFITIVFAFLVLQPSDKPALGSPHGTYSDYGRMYYDRLTGYFAGQGGEFTLRKDGIGLYGVADSLSNGSYASVAKAQDGDGTSFQTFCLETAEYVAQPLDLYVSTQNAALTGGGSHAYKGGTGLGDDLDPKTAWLYTQFATGTLSGYAYSGIVGGLNRSQTAGALQRLIWNIEGEGGALTLNSSFMGVTLGQAAQVDLITSWQSAYTTSGWTGIGNVRILQAYTTSGGGGLAQDQLYLVAPAPAAVLLGMLGLGAAGMKLRKYV